MLHGNFVRSQTKTNTVKASDPVKKKPVIVEKFKVSGRAFYRGSWCSGKTPTYEQEEEATKIKLLPITFYFINESSKSKKKTHVYCDSNGYFETQLPKGEYSVGSVEDYEVGKYNYKGKDTLRNSKLEDFSLIKEGIYGDMVITGEKNDLILSFHKKCFGTAE